MDLAGCCNHRFFCSTYILRCRYLPQNTADSGKVITTEGQVLYTGQDVKDGQNVWQSIGGQTVGSIWGHGAYIAPDWTADYLHREAILLLNELAKRIIKSITIYQMKSRPDIRFCYRKNYGRILLMKLLIRL